MDNPYYVLISFHCTVGYIFNLYDSKMFLHLAEDT